MRRATKAAIHVTAGDFDHKAQVAFDQRLRALPSPSALQQKDILLGGQERRKPISEIDASSVCVQVVRRPIRVRWSRPLRFRRR
jgi:hypothetical protein